MDDNQPLLDLPYEVQVDAGDLFHAEDNFTVPSSTYMTLWEYRKLTFIRRKAG